MTHDNPGRAMRTAGVDISKNHLDAYATAHGQAGRSRRFPNSPDGFQALARWIGTDIDRIAYEPTGAFHRDFEEALLAAGLPLYKINPYQVRCFARSQGRRAKTDAVDARTLADMAAAIPGLRPVQARSQTERDLAELQLVRDALVGDRTAMSNRHKHLRHPLAKDLNRRRLEEVKRQIKIVDAEIGKLLQQREDIKRRLDVLTSIPGLAQVSAAGLLVHMPELGSLSGARAASLAGLAPVTRESGSWKGRSYIQGGRRKVRQALFMPALSAIRHNPDLRRKYESLLARGKPPKLALAAVMRKLVVLANALLQQDRLWTPDPQAVHA